MNDTSRLFTALIISMGAIFLWNQYYVNPKLEAQKQAIEAQKIVENAKAPIDPQATKDFVKQKVDILTGAKDKAKNSTPAVASDAKISEMEATSTLSRAEILKQGSRLPIQTSNLHGSINLKGAVFDDITLAKYHETLDASSPEVALLTPRAMPGLYFLNTGWVSTETKAPDDTSIWQVESGKVLTPKTPVTLKYNNGEGQTFRKVISIDDEQMITTKLSVENKSSKAVSVLPYGLINRSWDMTRKQIYVSHEGPIAVVDKVLEEAKYKKLAKEDKPQEFSNVTGWAGIGDKYWLAAIIPQNSGSEKFNISFKHYTKNNVDRFQADILAQPQSIAAGATAEYNFNIFAGAKKLDLLEKYQEQYKIDLFDHAIDFGWFYFLTKPIFKALTFFHAHIGNMGLSIMLLTVCVRLIMFPIASKSFGSMARMKKHAPEIAKIKERHKKDRQKQGVEIMKYYKEHKINPASGCLPMFIQIPVFFSLYKVLYVSIEMRHAPFALWVHDLSAIDPTNIFTLFGLIMWNVPHFLPSLGILPILYAFTMWLQQNLNPPMADESQRVMMAWMPWIFMFLFSGFASGLVIYWIWNNSLSILQQYIITSRVKEDKAQ